MHIRPAFQSIRFSCPHCGALAHQYWYTLRGTKLNKDEVPTRYSSENVDAVLKNYLESEKGNGEEPAFFAEARKAIESSVFFSSERSDPYAYFLYNLEASHCDSCQDIAIWMQDRMVYPSSGPAGIASSDTPASVKSLYEEASAVFTTSARSSAALLRLALQVLLKELGEEGENINDDINKLFENGLSASLTKVMHSVRIIGNESVHPGEISVDDDPDIAEALFGLIDQIIDQLITQPRLREALWEKLPETKRKPVEDRLKKGNDK